MIKDNYIDPSVIEHYGVKGMRWGIRKMINKRREKKRRVKESRETAKVWNDKYHERTKMSDEDLKRAVDRLSLENRFAKEVAAANASLPQSGYRKMITGASKAVADAQEINKIYNNATDAGKASRENSHHAINLSRVAYQTAKAAAASR